MEVKKDPTGYIAFIFAAQMIMAWFMMCSLFKGECYLYYGLFSIACFPLYLQAGKDYMEMGDILSSALYYMFGTLFAGAMGFCYVAQFLDSLFSWGLEYNFTGALMLIGGVYLIPIIVVSVYIPWTEFVTWLLVDILMLGMGLSGFLGETLGYMCYMISVPLFLIVGILVLYMSLVAVFKSMGMQLPVGKPLMKYPEQ